jgi:integrase
MPSARTGHIERLPSGSYRAHAYAGTDPLTGKALYLRATAKTAEQAQIELGRLLDQAAIGRQPERGVTVGQLLDQFMQTAELDVSTRESYEGYIRRTIVPALGGKQLRKIRGPVLDTFYARLRRCSDLSCTGRPFTEHRSFPALDVKTGDRRPAWQQIADTIRKAIGTGQLRPGESLPSVRELASGQCLRTATLQHAFAVLAAEGLITVRQGRQATVADQAVSAHPRRTFPADADHDCAKARCRPHQCRPMSPKTIRNIHAILSGAFSCAVRWEWIDRNPAASAQPPKARYRPPSSPSPADVGAVITTARESGLDLVALYPWVAAITGARRGELCALQWADIDLEAQVVHVASGYLVRAGQKLRKDTKTHQDRSLAVDRATCELLREQKDRVAARLSGVGLGLDPSAYVFSNDPAGVIPWNPDWATHKVSDLAAEAGIKLNVKALRHYTASQLLAGGIDLRNTAARLGHGSGGATTLRHYADPVSEVDRRAAAYLAQLTAPAASGDSAPGAEPASAER